MWKSLSHVWLFATPWTVVHEIFRARILKWVAFPFSRGSSQPRDQTQVSHIVGEFFISWATGKPKNSGEGSLSFLQQIFPIQGSNWSHKGSPRILEWVAYPFFSRSSQPRDWTGVSCIAGRFFTNWAIREALTYGCESWTIKADRWGIDAFKLWCWRRLLSILWAARRTN